LSPEPPRPATAPAQVFPDSTLLLRSPDLWPTGALSPLRAFFRSHVQASRRRFKLAAARHSLYPLRLATLHPRKADRKRQALTFTVAPALLASGSAAIPLNLCLAASRSVAHSDASRQPSTCSSLSGPARSRIIIPTAALGHHHAALISSIQVTLHLNPHRGPLSPPIDTALSHPSRFCLRGHL
jgi:hypothetical protein